MLKGEEAIRKVQESVEATCVGPLKHELVIFPRGAPVFGYHNLWSIHWQGPQLVVCSTSLQGPQLVIFSTSLQLPQLVIPSSTGSQLVAAVQQNQRNPHLSIGPGTAPAAQLINNTKLSETFTEREYFSTSPWNALLYALFKWWKYKNSLLCFKHAPSEKVPHKRRSILDNWTYEHYCCMANQYPTNISSNNVLQIYTSPRVVQLGAPFGERSIGWNPVSASYERHQWNFCNTTLQRSVSPHVIHIINRWSHYDYPGACIISHP